MVGGVNFFSTGQEKQGVGTGVIDSPKSIQCFDFKVGYHMFA